MKQEIKDYIISELIMGRQLKDVARGIEEEFGVKMTKQNIDKFYKRYNSRGDKRAEELELAKECAEVRVRHRFTVGYIKDTTLGDISEFIRRRLIIGNPDIVDEAYEKLRDNVLDLYVSGEDPEDISTLTAYKDTPTDIRVIEQIIEEAKSIKLQN